MEVNIAHPDQHQRPFNEHLLCARHWDTPNRYDLMYSLQPFRYHYYPHFMDEATETQRGVVFSPR